MSRSLEELHSNNTGFKAFKGLQTITCLANVSPPFKPYFEESMPAMTMSSNGYWDTFLLVQDCA
jgi:hypothetical protein